MLEFQGPVVQRIVSLTKSLVNNSLSLLAYIKSSILIFFVGKKIAQLLPCKSLAHNIIFAKNGNVFDTIVLNNKCLFNPFALRMAETP